MQHRGYAVVFDPGSDRPIRELDTISCGHCQFVIHMKAPDLGEIGGYCQVCQRQICLKCYEAMQQGRGCDPFEEKLRRAESRDRLLRSIGI